MPVATLKSMKAMSFAAAALCAMPTLGVSDRSVTEFPRLAGETDDAPRFQRAVDSCCGGGVLTVPSGDYTLARTVFVTNLCSIEMSAGAYVKAVAEMDWMIKIDQMWQFSPKTAPKGVNAERYNLRYIGGTLDADGKASCLAIDNYRHFTLENATFLNGRRYGVGIETEGRGYEMIARNLYFKTLIHGLAGNVGLYTYGGDSHYTDIVVVDYTTGIHFAGRGANRLTRIHVWGGPVGHPAKAGELPEMLKNSVCFRIDSSGEIIRDCYADTGAIGFWVNGWEDRMYGCSYFNNKGFGLKDITILRQDKGTLWCDGCYFRANTPETKLYSGAPDAKIWWGDHGIYPGFWSPNRPLPDVAQPAEQPIDIDLGRQLFLDDVLFAKNTMKRTWHKPVDDPRNPVLKPETPLEKGGADGRNAAAVPHFGGVWYDGTDNLYKCFYCAGWSDGLAYATSRDGITWDRPKLQPDGGNLVFDAPAGAEDITTSVVLDPDALDGQRFKAYAFVPHGPRENHAMVRMSPDGIRWSAPFRMGKCGDASTIFYNPFTRYWGFSLRGWSDDYGRLREYAESDSFVGGAKSLAKRKPWLRDVVGGRKKTGEQLYNFNCVAYEGVLVGLAMVMKGPENEHWAKLGEPKDTYLKFGFSRNRWDWTFPAPEGGGPFIAGTRRYGDWNMGYVRPNSGICIVTGDELRFYYGAFAGDRNKAIGGWSVAKNGMYANGAMGIATLRRDGFCSVQDGEIRTKQLIFSRGDRLWVNADARQGELSIRVVGQDGKCFGERKMSAMDSTRLEVGALEANKPFSLVFSSTGGAKLYSFWTGGADGRSGGYLAGGSPESATLRDEATR